MIPKKGGSLSKLNFVRFVQEIKIAHRVLPKQISILFYVKFIKK